MPTCARTAAPAADAAQVNAIAKRHVEIVAGGRSAARVPARGPQTVLGRPVVAGGECSPPPRAPALRRTRAVAGRGRASRPIASGRRRADGAAGEAMPFAIDITSAPRNYDSGGMSIGRQAHAGHLGVILYGEAAVNDVRMDNGKSLFATLAQVDPALGGGRAQHERPAATGEPCRLRRGLPGLARHVEFRRALPRRRWPGTAATARLGQPGYDVHRVAQRRSRRPRGLHARARRIAARRRSRSAARTCRRRQLDRRRRRHRARAGLPHLDPDANGRPVPRVAQGLPPAQVQRAREIRARPRRSTGCAASARRPARTDGGWERRSRDASGEALRATAAGSPDPQDVRAIPHSSSISCASRSFTRIPRRRWEDCGDRGCSPDPRSRGRRCPLAADPRQVGRTSLLTSDQASYFRRPYFDVRAIPDPPHELGEPRPTCARGSPLRALSRFARPDTSCVRRSSTTIRLSEGRAHGPRSR